MPHRTRRVPVAAAVLVVLALFGAACGDDRAPGATAPASSAGDAGGSLAASDRPPGDAAGSTSAGDRPAQDGTAGDGGAGTGTPATTPGDPVDLATRLVAAERTIRDPATAPDQLTGAALAQQQLYRELARHPEWDATVTATLPADLITVAQLNLDARRQFRMLVSTLSDNLPAWAIVAPAPAEALLADYHEAEAAFGVPWQYLAAVNLVESGMGRIRGTSVAGAQGPMQFLPATWARYGGGGDIDDPHDAVLGAARYLAANGGASGNIDGALWNYNHHPAYVQGVKDYAAVMAADPRTYLAYHDWDVIYLSSVGDVRLPVGYQLTVPIPAAEYLATHPQDR